MRISSIIICLFISSLLFGQQQNAFFQKSIIHKIDGRSSYSLFIPSDIKKVTGVVLLLHHNQAYNPKLYGGLIEFLLKQNQIVAFPAYQDLVVNKAAKDLQYISNSTNEINKRLATLIENHKTIPWTYIAHGSAACLALKLATNDKNPLVRKPNGIVFLAPIESKGYNLDQIDVKRLDNYDAYLIIDEKNSKGFKKQCGQKINTMLQKIRAQRLNYKLHETDSLGRSHQHNVLSNKLEYSTKQNSFLSYLSWYYAKTNEVDTKLYWPNIKQTLECAVKRKNCN